MLRSFCLVLLAFISFQSFGQNCAQLSVYFGSNKSRIKNNTKSQIDSLIFSLDTSETYLIEISGFADSIGTFEYNYELANERTKSITSYVQTLRNKSVIVKQYVYGETSVQQELDDKNRRVEIFYTKIHKDSTIEIRGDQGEKVYLPYGFFCSSICNVNPQIMMKSFGDSEKELSITFDYIDSNVFCNSRCIPLTIRLPRLIFLANENLNISDSIFFRNCLGSFTPGKKYDSLSKENAPFNVRYDKITQEYIVTHPCILLSRGFVSCCGTKPCNSPGFTILGLNEFQYASYDVTYNGESISPNNHIYYDTTINYIKSKVPHQILLNILVEANDEIYEGIVPLDSLKLSRIHNTETIKKYKTEIDSAQSKCLVIYSVSTYDLNQVKRSKKLVKIKVPRNAEIDSIGFKLKPSGYFISMNKVDPRCYEHLHIKTGYDIAVYHHNTMTILKKSKMKKVKKRGYLKIRRRDLK